MLGTTYVYTHEAGLALNVPYRMNVRLITPDPREAVTHFLHTKEPWSGGSRKVWADPRCCCLAIRRPYQLLLATR